MRKNIWVMTLVVLTAGAGLTFAQETKAPMPMEKGMAESMTGKGMMGQGMGKGMMGMCPMMQSMMQRSVVAVGDGGVIIVSGNKLTKYDKDLNVVKEVELKTDMEGMRKMMDMMKSMCPMMGNMNKDSSQSGGVGESVSADEHSSHHPGDK